MYQGPKSYIAQICEVHLCSMETVQRNGRFTLFSSQFPSNIYSILFVYRIDRQSYRRDTYKLKEGGGG